MKILHLSTHTTGGAGSAAVRLHRALLADGVESMLIAAESRVPTPDAIELGWGGAVARLQLAAGRAASAVLSDQEFYFPLVNVRGGQRVSRKLAELGFRPDVIVCHWVAFFLEMDDICALSNEFDAPVVWNMVDMAWLTGGCHYAWDCKGYLNACGNCPAHHLPAFLDPSARVLEAKRRALGRMRSIVLANSEQQWREASQAAIFKGIRIERTLPPVMDLNLFKPADDRLAARARLGLPADARIVLAGSHILSRRRKGLQYMVEAMQIVGREAAASGLPVVLAIAGEGSAFKDLRIPGVDIRLLGYLGAQTTLVTAYQAADVFVCPSIEDSGPMMVLEAISCGTPVASFEMGVSWDLVFTGETGYRARLKDTRDLANGILQLLRTPDQDLDALRARCRALALRALDPDMLTRRLKQIYASAISGIPVGPMAEALA